MISKKNPLAEFAKNLPYSKIAEITGLHENTLRNISKMDNEKLKRVELGTFTILKDKLNIDLAENITY